MDKKTKSELEILENKARELCEELDAIRNNEQEIFNGMPNNSDDLEEMSLIVGSLECAVGSMDESIVSMEKLRAEY